MADDGTEVIKFPDIESKVPDRVSHDVKIINLPSEEAQLKGAIGKITKTFSGNKPVDHKKLPNLAIEFAKASLGVLEAKGPNLTPEDATRKNRLESAIHEAEALDFTNLGQIVRKYGDFAVEASEKVPKMAAIGTAFAILAENISQPIVGESKIIRISSNNPS